MLSLLNCKFIRFYDNISISEANNNNNDNNNSPKGIVNNNNDF